MSENQSCENKNIDFLTVPKKCDFFFEIQMSLVLMKISQQGIAHHDVKPANMLIQEIATSSGKPSYRFILIDFGLAVTQGTLADGEDTQTGMNDLLIFFFFFIFFLFFLSQNFTENLKFFRIIERPPL